MTMSEETLKKKQQMYVIQINNHVRTLKVKGWIFEWDFQVKFLFN